MNPRYSVWLAAALAALVAAGACGRRDGEPTAKAPAVETLWQCPMHPEIVRKEPGECPICHMKLQSVEKAPELRAGGVAARAGFDLSFARRQLIGVRLVEAEAMELARTVRAPGRIAYDPGLYAALEEHRLAAEAVRSASGASSAQQILSSTRMKLRLMGLSDAQIDRAASSSRESARGLVLGGKGASVWVYASVYERDLGLVKPGQDIEIDVPAYPGERFKSKVAAVDSVINPGTRTARVRAQITDAAGRLLPEMYLQVRIKVPLGRKVAIPRDAVLDTGERQLVFKVTGDRFEPVAVVLGAEADAWVEVKEGVSAGDKVVAAANFLIDSEAQFRAAAEQFRAQEGAGAAAPHAH